jgi:hypothetical protein
MSRLPRLLARLVAGSAMALPLVAAPPAGAVTIPTVVAVRAAPHPGYDRLVLQFSGGLPTVHAAWTQQLTWPQTGRPVAIAGHAFALVSATPAQGHTFSGHQTLPSRMTFALPNLTELVVTEDFEAHVSIGLGLQRHTSLHVFRLTSPDRLVIDVGGTWPTVAIRDYFLHLPSFAVGHTPYVRPATRPVAAGAVARQALERLFAGPTPAEKAAGLHFAASGAKGFSSLTISHGVARVRLTGSCSSHGSTFTIAQEIAPTLKQFASVHWVKIYDQLGHTGSPTGQVDSIPACLEP